MDAVTVNNSSGGFLEATAGGTLNLQGGVTIANSGTIEADGGIVVVASTTTITGAASVIIAAGGTADFVGSSSAPLSLNAVFSGANAGTLELGQPTQYTGTITGFASGDAIDLPALAYQSSEYAVWTQTTTTNGGSGTLQLFSGTTLADTFNLAGTYNSYGFAVQQDLARVRRS